MTLLDAPQRNQATSPEQSFIVQAPAGSGKTEILTQRYLRLLHHVNAPEQIVALTFTKKAANEMRERILNALKEVAHGVKAQSSHQATTHSYAKDALSRSEALNWQLLEQPSRLRIMTIDSLCQTLTNAIHLTTDALHKANINDKPQGIYKSAALSCIEYMQNETSCHKNLKTLLRHLDNRQDLLLNLFCQLINNRDQWLPIVYQARTHTQEDFEHSLNLIINHELQRFKDCLPEDLAHALVTLSNRVACIENNPQSARYCLQNLQDINLLDSETAAGLAALLLTTSNTLRKSFDHHVGVKKGSCSDPEYALIKSSSKELLAELNELPDFVSNILRVRHLPYPKYDAQQWEILQALLTVLPLLVAHVHLIFNQHNQVDFLAIAQNSFLALGSDDEPTDLALYLDHQIQHILIDEFQDTSLQQFQLLISLTRGWESNDGRTLFVVGDPMQSIYRFRAAEVGLFLRAREYGIGTIKLTSLELKSNFRSTPTIIQWINQQFANIFPATDDLESGAVSYLHASSPHESSDTTSFIQAYQCTSREQEATEIVAKVLDELSQHPNDNIAILVKTRNQLSTIIKLLKQNSIPFQGVDIDSLAHLPHIQDLWALTQALLFPANRLAWLSFLRSPWCGLSLHDLHIIANIDNNKSIYYALSQIDSTNESSESTNNLSADGKIRATWIYNVLHSALTQRHQYNLVDWLIQTLHNLHINKILTQPQQNELEQYWMLLEQFESAGQIENIALFQQELNKLYSKQVVPARLQIMTIHKSKGLEFDTVILPSLGSRSSVPDTPLLRWLHLPSQENGDLLLLSPIKAAGDEADLLYQYLTKINAEKEHYEQQRLLYVAATRAKKRLYLFDHHTNIRHGSFRDFLHNQPMIDLSELSENNINMNDKTPILYRLPISYYQNQAIVSHVNQTTAVQNLSKHNNLAKWTGIIVHELLQWICTYHPNNIHEIPWQLARSKMTSLGMNVSEQDQLMQNIQQQITAVFHDPIGKWIISKHQDEQNESEWICFDNNEIQTKIIDRTFVENGIRWIIDFKTGEDTIEKQSKHQEQVNQYCKLFIDSSEKTYGGLYYLKNNNWVNWSVSLDLLQT